MIYKNFDDLKLSRIVFGAASISGEGAGYGFGDISSNDSIDLLSYAYSEGINVFDTAPIYGFGESETRLGLAFEKIRDKVVICSKAGVGWHDNKRVNMSNEPKLIAKMFDESRRRLKSDYIDIYMIHWPDKNVDIRKSLEPLYKLKNQGAIKYIGLCNTHTTDLSLSQDIDFIQSEFNYFNNGFKDIDKSNYQTMGWGSFDKGILSGSVTTSSKFDKSDCRSWAPWWKKSDWKSRVNIAQELQSKIHPKSLVDFSVNYSLENIDFPIFGMRKKSHIDSISRLL